MDILSSITGRIVEYTLEPIGRQAGYLLFYKDNLKELNDQIETLQAMKERIEHQVEVERRNGREIEGDVLIWKKRVIGTLEEAKQLCEDPRHANVRCSKWSFPNLKARHQLSRKARKMTTTIFEVKENGKFEDGVGYVPPRDIANIISAPSRYSDKLNSRNMVTEKILLSLRDPNKSKIGVYGVSGVGKSTLVRELAKKVKEDALFDVVVMANVSQMSDLEKVQDEIAYQLGLRLEETTSLGRADCLCERIKKEKTILIILDDLWDKIDLEKLGIPSIGISEKINSSEKLEVPLEDDYKGCKLLLTSRNLNILKKNETQENFVLQHLNNVESWGLFKDIVGDAVEDDNLKAIATQVAQSCHGLPANIVTIATLLKDREIHHWRDAWNKLKSSNNEDRHETFFSPLELINYEQLKDDAKEVFLLCGVHGPSILFSDLLKYAIGLGALKCINTIEDARSRLHTIIDDLKASCLVLDDTNVDDIEIPNFACEVAISIASKDQNVILKKNASLQEWPSKGDSLRRCTQIILMKCLIPKLPKKLDCPNLKFLHINSSDKGTLEIPDSFFEGMENLQALDLTGMIIPSLPISLASLTKLKTLCLDHCTLKDIARIGALKKLEILSFINSSMEEFPSEIGQLTQLRMLDLSNSGMEIIQPNILSKLTKLEELYMGNTSIKWGVESSTKQKKNASLVELGHLTSLTTLEIQIHEAQILPTDIMFDKLDRYKVVIGDNWKWSHNKGISRLLKLKLDISIRSKHGIKTLVKRVDNLYLDELSGFSNELSQLNGEGFPHLKLLHVQNDGKIQYINNSTKKNQKYALFPIMETLILQNLNSLVKICHSPLPDSSFGRLKVIKVQSCEQLVYLFSISMVQALSHLVEINVSKCNSMKKVVSVENAKSGMSIDDKIEFNSLGSLSLCQLPVVANFYSNELTTEQNSLGPNVRTPFFNAQVKFSKLETLKLSSINLEKIWDDDHLSAAYSIDKLANLTIEDCGGLNYLFSSSMIGSLVNLKQLEVKKCDMMEEIIATEVRNGSTIQEARFSKLESIVINNMKSLKKVWHFQFDRLKTLEVNNCEKLENIFPYDMQRTFESLETLKVSDCSSLEVIFQLTSNEIQSEEEALTRDTKLKKLQLFRLPKLKQIWSKDPQGILIFQMLREIQVESCGNIEYLFPFSIAMDLPQLEKLYMRLCGGMKEIVAKKEGHMGEIPTFDFPRLYSLHFLFVSELAKFYAGNDHILDCPMLRVLSIFQCPKLVLFETAGQSNQTKNSDSRIVVPMRQPLFIDEEVIPSLEELTLSNSDAMTILQDQRWRGHFNKLKLLRLYNFQQATTFIDLILQKASNLKFLVVQDSSLKEIFQDGRPEREEGRNEINNQLKRLSLYRLHKLQYISRPECQIDAILDVLEVLYVSECACLKFWAPCSVTFSCLTRLEIEKCHGLANLFYLSIARSLVKLKSLKLRDCNSLEEIVTQEVGETTDEIVLSSLENLELECLPRFRSFSSSKSFFKFPLLKKVVVMQCPRMKIFCERGTSTPMLRKIIKERQEEWLWEGDLNGTIENIFLDKVAFRWSKHLELSLYPELKESWYGSVENRIFCNLTSLVVKNCGFLSNVLIPSNLLLALQNLEELEVIECDSLEVVFEFNSTNEVGMSEQEVTHLRKIFLSNLPKLQYIWKQGCQEIVKFGDSEDVHAKRLNMSKAPSNGGKMEEDEVEIHCQQPLFSVAKVDLPNLETITIRDMQNLKAIWNPIISFGNLQVLKVDKCQQLKKLFSVSLCQDLRQLEELNIESCGVEEIVSIEEGLEEFKIEFPRLTLLRLIQLTQLTAFYPRKYTLDCPSLKKLNVRGCEKLQIFAFRHLNSQPLREGDIELQNELALFYIEKVSQNLEELSLNERDAMRILNGNYKKNLFQSIRILRLQYFQETPIKVLNNLIEKFPVTMTFQARCSSFKTFFPPEGIGCCNIEDLTQIKTLWLFQLEQLEHIWFDDSMSHPLVQNLEHLKVRECSRLKTLAPPSISFKNLTKLTVEDCNGLIYFMTSFTAKSLVHLTWLVAKNCEMLEEIVMTSDGELEEVITFESLKYLELSCLSSFKSFCSGKHTFIFSSLVTLKVMGCHKMQNFSSGVATAPFLKMVDVEDGERHWKEDLNTTIEHLFKDNEIEGVDVNPKESSSKNIERSQTHQMSASTSRALCTRELGVQSKTDEIVDSEKQKIYKLPFTDAGNDTQKMRGTPPEQASQNISSPTKDAEMNEATQTPLAEAVESTLSRASVQESGTQEMREIIERLLVQLSQKTVSPTAVQDGDIRTHAMYKTIEVVLDLLSSSMVNNIAIDPSLSRSLEALPSSTQDADESRDLEIQSSENFHVQTTTFIADEDKDKMQEIGIQRPLVQTTEETLSPAFEKSHGQEMVPNGKNLSAQTTSSIVVENRTSTDPAPSRASETMTISAFVAEAYLPYLEAGVGRHPQVLDWLNAKQRRVFAPLFAEVTRILRTTRRADLKEDDRNYIKECCAALEVVGFEASWRQYVYGCIEDCDDGEDIKSRLEEVEAKASSLEEELASLKESIVLLHDKANKLDNFIES